jgi:hypothetical protein
MDKVNPDGCSATIYLLTTYKKIFGGMGRTAIKLRQEKSSRCDWASVEFV